MATKIMTATQLMAKELPEARWAVEGLVPEGLSILAGKPKCGKSWLALDLLLAVTTGVTALGAFPVQQGPALGIFAEDTERRLKSRIEMRTATGLWVPSELNLTTEWPRLSEGGLAELEEWLVATANARLVVIDTLAKVRPPSRTRSAYQDDYDAMGGLQGLANKHHVAILVLHHVRKMLSEDWLDDISGTLGLSGAADAIMRLKRTRTEAKGSLAVTGRDVEESEIELEFKAEVGAWTQAEPSSRDLSPQRQAITRLLEQAGRDLTPKEVATLLDKDHQTTKALLFNMRKAGQLESTGSGSYRLPTSIR